MDNMSLAAADSRCLRAVANALIVDHGLIAFLRDLAPQWGSSTGKTRSYSGLVKGPDDASCCILRVDSRTAILLNDALYRHQGPATAARQMAEALRHPEIAADGQQCRIAAPGLPPLIITIAQYADAEGLPVAPDSPGFHHRVVSIMPG